MAGLQNNEEKGLATSKMSTIMSILSQKIKNPNSDIISIQQVENSVIVCKHDHAKKTCSSKKYTKTIIKTKSFTARQLRIEDAPRSNLYLLCKKECMG